MKWEEKRSPMSSKRTINGDRAPKSGHRATENNTTLTKPVEENIFRNAMINICGQNLTKKEKACF